MASFMAARTNVIPEVQHAFCRGLAGLISMYRCYSIFMTMTYIYSKVCAVQQMHFCRPTLC